MNLIFRYVIPIIFMVVVLITSPGGAIAQTRPLYFGIFGGYTIPQDMTWQSKTSDDSLDLSVDNTGMIGFKLGYILPQARMLALEGEYYHIFEHNYGPAETSDVREVGDLYLDNFFFNLLLRYPKGRIHPYGGAGIGFSYFEINNLETFQGITFEEIESDTAFAWQILAGLNFDIAPNLSADLTYRYFETDPHLSFVDVEYRTSVISAGINFHF